MPRRSCPPRVGMLADEDGKPVPVEQANGKSSTAAACPVTSGRNS
ncbi:hypothetical protein [Saccharopolyspora gregorii]